MLKIHWENPSDLYNFFVLTNARSSKNSFNFPCTNLPIFLRCIDHIHGKCSMLKALNSTSDVNI